MKRVLFACDSCGKEATGQELPEGSVGMPEGWAMVVMTVARPKRSVARFKGHVCSHECLVDFAEAHYEEGRLSAAEAAGIVSRKEQ